MPKVARCGPLVASAQTDAVGADRRRRRRPTPSAQTDAVGADRRRRRRPTPSAQTDAVGAGQRLAPHAPTKADF